MRSSDKTFTAFRKSNPVQPPFYKNIKIGLNLDREILFKRIDQRMDEMISMGLFDEAERLLPFRAHNALQTVGYKEIFHYFDGDYDYTEAVRLLKRNSRRYAKRQLTWFKKDSDIHWIAPNQMSEALAIINKELDTHHMDQSH
jgi:tRNA dimethylallyltransferase